MKLTEHFDSSEFLVSDSYPELASVMKLDDHDLHKCFLLSAIFLEPFRQELGAIKILSGKRSEALNDRIKGEPNSHHLFRGWSAACDWCFPEPKTEDRKIFKLFMVYHRITSEMKNAFGECFLYVNEDGIPNFMHLALPTFKDRGQFGKKIKTKKTT